MPYGGGRGALEGAGAGASIGSMVAPGLGTAIGGGLGGLAGLLFGGHAKQDPQKELARLMGMLQSWFAPQMEAVNRSAVTAGQGLAQNTAASIGSLGSGGGVGGVAAGLGNSLTANMASQGQMDIQKFISQLAVGSGGAFAKPQEPSTWQNLIGSIGASGMSSGQGNPLADLFKMFQKHGTSSSQTSGPGAYGVKYNPNAGYNFKF